ncbi:hypothetical protein V8F20_004719 [Naviculisporaceae sp. PSN 640]
MERKRIVHRLDTPYSTVEWPVTSQEDQDVILELLCNLLAPIGLYRRSFTKPSRGKRKRRQQQAEDKGEPAKPPLPEIHAHVDVGLANISRNLQEMVTVATGRTQEKDIISEAPSKESQAAAPEGGKETEGEGGPIGTANKGKSPVSSSPYSIIFVARSGQSSAFHCHFPQMVALASKSQPVEKAIILVGFSKSCEGKLSEALGIPRVSSIALRGDAPELQVKGLLDYVRDHVPLVEVAWLEEARLGKYRETNIEGVPTKIGQSKTKK